MERKIVVLSNGNQEEEVKSVAASLRASGIAYETIELSKGEPLPKELDGLCGLLILGGPITVYDQDTTPFLRVYFNA